MVCYKPTTPWELLNIVRNLVEDGTLRYQHLNAFDREMHHLESRHAFCRPHLHQWIMIQHNQDKVIAFEKGDGLLFVFNFHPVKSFFDYTVGVLWPVSCGCCRK